MHCWVWASRSPPGSLSLRQRGTELPGQDSFSGSSLSTAGCRVTLRLRLQPSSLLPHSPGEAGSPEAEEPAWGLGPHARTHGLSPHRLFLTQTTTEHKSQPKCGC